MTTFTKQITVDADDGYDTGPGTYTGGDGIVVGNNGSTQFTMGVRFAGVTIPQAATVSSATLTLKSVGPDNGSPGTITIKGIAADNCVAFGTTAPVSTSKTSASVSAGHGGADGTAYALTVTTIVQEILNRAGWASGNAMGFAGTGPGITTGTNQTSYHDVLTSSANAPTLSVTYTTSIAITPANAANAHASSSPTLAAKSTITAANAANANASTSPTLAAKSTFTVNAAAHAHASTSPVLTSNVVTGANALHAHSSTSPTLTAKSSITANNAANSHAATAPALTAKSIVVPANALHGNTATSPTIAALVIAVTPSGRIAAGIGGNAAGRIAAGIGGNLSSRTA